MSTGQPSKTSKGRIDVAKRRAEALELRRAGLTFQDIADRLGYKHRSAAHKDVQRALEKLIFEPAQDVLALELSRLDALTQTLWAQARRGDLQAIDRIVKLMNRRAKYLGLDAPERHEVITLDAIEAEIARLSSELGEAGQAAGTSTTQEAD